MSLRLWLLIAWAGVIFAASSVPGKAMPPIGETDWILHSGEYLVLGLLTSSYASGRGLKSLKYHLISLLGCVAYGMSDELHQFFVPGRYPSWGDVMADSLGAMVGVSIYWFWKNFS